MNRKQLEWLITAASNTPVQNLEQVRHKANCLLALAEMIEDAIKSRETEPDTPADPAD